MGIFKVFTNVSKAVVAVAVSPVALAVDIITLPVSADDYRRGVFDRTSSCLKSAGKCIDKAVEPE